MFVERFIGGLTAVTALALLVNLPGAWRVETVVGPHARAVYNASPPLPVDPWEAWKCPEPLKAWGVAGGRVVRPAPIVHGKSTTTAPDAPACVLIAFFHFDKAGGTAFREHMERASQGCRDAPNIACGQPAFDRLSEHSFTAWKKPDVRTSVPRAWVELHASRFHERIAEVEAVKQAVRGTRCSVLSAVLLREPVSQLVSAYKYFGVRQNSFNGSVEEYAETICRKFRAGHCADWFLGQVKFFMPKALNPCRQLPGAACDPACWSFLDDFFRRIDLVAITEEWESFFAEVAWRAGIARLPLLFRAGNCRYFATQRVIQKRLAAPEGGGHVAPLAKFVPCSRQIYAKYARRYQYRMRRELWPKAWFRERLCALELQHTCRLHHAALDDESQRTLADLEGGGKGRSRGGVAAVTKLGITE